MSYSVQYPIADRILAALTVPLSWKELYEVTGRPAMSTLSYAVRVLEQAGKVEREQVVFPPKYNYKEDRTHAARVLIRRTRQ